MRLFRRFSFSSKSLPRRRRLWRQAAFAACSVPLVMLAAGAAYARTRGNHRDETARHLQDVLDEVRQRLGIAHAVSVTLVPKNPHVVSVEAPARPDEAYVVRVEEGLLQLLTPDELEAALAHELGHVWVFTNHPYLQTELLANQVALRAVSRDALTRVYEKVWKKGGTKGNLARYLGAEPAESPRQQQQ